MMNDDMNFLQQIIGHINESKLQAEEERKLAALDQMQAGVKEFAQMMRALREDAYKAFVEEGFPEDIAESMAFDLARNVVRNAPMG